MKTSVTEQIEKYLHEKLSIADRLLFDAKLIIDPVLRRHVRLQKKLYAIVRQSGRRELKSDVQQIHHRLFNDPEKATFREQVYKLFQHQ